MWETLSNSLIILFICFMEFGEIQAQCNRPFVGENRIIADESQEQVFPEGHILTFKCSYGYQLVQSGASRTVTCTNKQWTQLDLECTKKSCGNPGELPNGRYLTPNGITFGSTATAQCNKGFLVAGTKTRNCQESGWDGRIATCKVVKCLTPPTIENGEFEPVKDYYNYNEAVSYSCTGEYTLIGESTLSCSDNGTFYPSPPQCMVISCDAPKIEHAVRTGGRSPPYRYKEFVEYKCNVGYQMEGGAFMTCEESGWKPTPPKCNVLITGPTRGPNLDETTPPDKNNHSRNISIGAGVGISIFALIILGAVCYMKKGPGWGKVPTRNEGA